MLAWSLGFLITALVAALMGFSGIAGASAWIAKLIFALFLAIFMVSLAVRFARGAPPPR